MGARTFIDYVKKYFRFSLREIEELLTISLVFGFILTFTDWGTTSFDFVVGVVNLLLGFGIVLFSLFLHNSAKKLWAIYHGHTVEHSIWTLGVIVSLLICLLTNGGFMLFLSSRFSIVESKIKRLGKKKGVDISLLAHVAIVGLLVNAFIAAIAYYSNSVSESFIMQKAATFNLLYIAYNVLPLPQIDGSRIFLASRLLYCFVFVSALTFVILALFGYPSFILALGTGLIASVIFWFFFEKDWQ